MLDDRTALNGKTLCALRTVKDVVEQYSSTEEIPLTPALLRAYRNAHKAYKEAAEEAKKQQEKAGEKRKQTLDDAATQLQAKKSLLELKQKDAEKLISEGTDRLTKSVAGGKMTDILPAQALIASGNKILQEC